VRRATRVTEVIQALRESLELLVHAESVASEVWPVNVVLKGLLAVIEQAMILRG
jgi:hypothetical protein